MSSSWRSDETPVRTVEPELLTNPRDDARETLERLRKLTHLMDEAFTIPGTSFRVGWDSIIGLLPVAGDLIGAAVSAVIIFEAKRLGVSRWGLLRMTANATTDVLVGLIPVAGDAADAVWKANSRNLKILEKHIRKQERRVPRARSGETPA